MLNFRKTSRYRFLSSLLYGTIHEIMESICGGIPIHEQEEIAEFLDCKCSEIDSLVREKQELIIDFEQYKHSLIYETVTGKRKVV